jgi:acetyl-CoA carboxylase biotin carboxylase subunit/3-methylcrotonyl-CoA carboxylase alpha subunit
MFDKILIANRGEIACRIARTCRRVGIRTVAVYSEADAASLHRAAADESVAIGPPPVQQSYLDADRIVAAAKQTGVQAVHPGYGLLSENAGFARKVAEAGLVFIGPPADVLGLVGDKMRARHTARAAGVEPVPGATDPLPDLPAARALAESIGWPVVVKAVGGGGGIGMQIVRAPGGLERAWKACGERGGSAFGDARVYVEAYVPHGRHVEVQLLCDAHGNRLALGERECSMQRRHQKIVEESPAPGLDRLADGAERRTKLHAAALRVAAAAGYVNAGTCEFLMSPAGELYFLEVNARLQVEHPVTEEVTGLDLVEEQLRIAAGEPLSPAVRAAEPAGHAIEVRLYAENPAKSFFPSPGKVETLRWPSGARVEAGIQAGDTVTPHYDPLVAKLITSGPTREEARVKMAQALAETEVGPLITNLGFLRTLIDGEPFRSGEYDTTTVESSQVRKP